MDAEFASGSKEECMICVAVSICDIDHNRSVSNKIGRGHNVS